MHSFFGVLSVPRALPAPGAGSLHIGTLGLEFSRCLGPFSSLDNVDHGLTVQGNVCLWKYIPCFPFVSFGSVFYLSNWSLIPEAHA